MSRQPDLRLQTLVAPKSHVPEGNTVTTEGSTEADGGSMAQRQSGGVYGETYASEVKITADLVGYGTYLKRV